jgi:hypothetical protein
MTKVKKIAIMILALFWASSVLAQRTETEVIIFANGFKTGTNADVCTNVFPAAFTPYIMTFAASNGINITNGNYQYYAPTSATTLWMPNSPSNQGYSIRVDINPGTNSFSFGTNNLCFTTNDVIGVGANTIRIRTNEATPLIYDKAYSSTNWRVINL